MAEKEKHVDAPPYVAFKTFWNFLDKLGQIGTPPRIDRSVWGDSLSGAYGAQLMAALRFLGLIDDTGYAVSDLRRIAEDAEARREFLRANLLELYSPVLHEFGVDLSEATPAQLDDAFKETYKITGATKTKAIAFLVHAAKAAQLPISPYIVRKTRQRTTTGKAKRKASKKAANGATPAAKREPKPTLDGESDSHERIVTLRSGGSLRMTIDYNPFKLSTEDREFVFGLIDVIQRYEGGEASE